MRSSSGRLLPREQTGNNRESEIRSSLTSQMLIYDTRTNRLTKFGNFNGTELAEIVSLIFLQVYRIRSSFFLLLFDSSENILGNQRPNGSRDRSSKPTG